MHVPQPVVSQVQVERGNSGEHDLARGTLTPGHMSMIPGGTVSSCRSYLALMSPMPDQAQLPCSHFLRYLQGFLDPFV